MHEHKLVEFLGMTFHLDTIYMTWLSSAIVLLIAVLATRNLAIIPQSRWQHFIEMIAEALLDQVDNNIGPKGRKVAPLIMTLFIYLVISNWLGLVPGLTSPTNDINCTLGLAVMIVITVNFLGVRNKGFFGHFSHFIKPNIVFLPINLIEEISKPVTLSARLFGNIFAGEILIVILGMLVPYLIPTVWLAFSVFVGIVQAMIFTIMSMTYLANALQDNH
jgi:F-type H+-transporting ATPase subunit a